MIKKSIFFLILGIIAIAGFLFSGQEGSFYTPFATDKQALLSKEYSRPQGPYVIIEGTEIPVEIATTSMAVQKGLSGRASLDSDKGMLFIFAKLDWHRFWMPDMYFPIDIICIDKNKKVVGISKNVSPEFDPANPRFYQISKPTQFVLEVNAGFSDAYGINPGDPVSFHNLK